MYIYTPIKILNALMKEFKRNMIKNPQKSESCAIFVDWQNEHCLNVHPKSQ